MSARGLRSAIGLAILMLIAWLLVIVLVVHPGRTSVEAATSYTPKNGDPCVLNLRVTSPINLTASAQMITGTAGKQTYICSMLLVNAAAQNVALVEGTGAVCATNTIGMAGGNTAATGFNMAVNQALWVDSPGWWSIVTATTGDNVCLLLSGTTQLSGFIQYAQM